MRFSAIFAFSAVLCASCAFGAASEIKVSLSLANSDYVAGERVRGVIDVLNASPHKVSVGYANSEDRLIVEVFRANDRSQLEKISKGDFTAQFVIHPNEGQKLEVILGNHFGLREERRYLVRPVLIHRGMRYEGETRSFRVVGGMKVASALQLFRNREGLRRNFELVKWNRGGSEHIFLTAYDEVPGERDLRYWQSTDLGSFLRVTKPTISIKPTGEVSVLHRLDPENFVNSEFWSVPQGIELVKREKLQDPDVAGQNRIRELYSTEQDSIKPPVHHWWEFWKGL